MSLAEYLDRPARVREPQSRRRWLACTPRLARPRLARPPIPQRGLGRGLSIVRSALVPACASHGDTARQTALPGPPDPAVQSIKVFREIL
jgi:hypothetical protein